MMWHCAAYRVYINPSVPRVLRLKLFYAPNPIAATPSLLLHILPALLSALFTFKELDVHLVQEKGMVMPGTGRLQDIFDRLLLQLQMEF